MAAQPEASTVVRATVEASTVVVAALVEAVTEVAAEATVAESTRSIQLYPVKSKRASWANPTVGPASSCPPISSSFRCCHFRRAPFVFGFDGNLRAWCVHSSGRMAHWPRPQSQLDSRFSNFQESRRVSRSTGRRRQSVAPAQLFRNLNSSLTTVMEESPGIRPFE